MHGAANKLQGPELACGDSLLLASRDPSHHVVSNHGILANLRPKAHGSGQLARLPEHILKQAKRHGECMLDC